MQTAIINTHITYGMLDSLTDRNPESVAFMKGERVNILELGGEAPLIILVSRRATTVDAALDTDGFYISPEWLNPISEPFAGRIPVDLRRKRSMVEFLLKHPRYGNGKRGAGNPVAWEVKIPTLGLPEYLEFSAYHAYESGEGYEGLDDLFSTFDARHNTGVQMDGRSNGYIVLGGISADMDDGDYENWDMDDLRWLVRLVQAFDTLVDTAVQYFLGVALDYYMERLADPREAGRFDGANALKQDRGLNFIPAYLQGYNEESRQYDR